MAVIGTIRLQLQNDCPAAKVFYFLPGCVRLNVCLRNNCCILDRNLQRETLIVVDQNRQRFIDIKIDFPTVEIDK